MNSEHALPVEQSVQQWIGEAEDYARRDPVKAVGIAFGVGLALNILPKRLIVGATTLAAVTLVRPVLLSLGVMKAFELCCAKQQKPSPSIQDPPLL